MSADNGIYILPLKDGYYVSHCQAIDNLTYGIEEGYNPEVVINYFGPPDRAVRFDTVDEALNYAREAAKDYYILEYGITILEGQPYSMADYKTMMPMVGDIHDVGQVDQPQCPPESSLTEVATLPNGCYLYRKDNGVGGHSYFSDEIGGGVNVWDTSLVAESTLIAAILDQHKLRYQEAVKKGVV